MEAGNLGQWRISLIFYEKRDVNNGVESPDREHTSSLNPITKYLSTKPIIPNTHSDSSGEPLRIISVNSQSMINKINRIEVVLGRDKPDIFCVSESWYVKESLDSVKLNGYVIADAYCRSLKLHGGTIIFTK
ncbi:hypothetical protein JTB14_033264 [Gonioctena quinquepunctata]|nr:hypothetical protein JTB14_033264 [Gonioctena quinquepunctata]